MPTNREEHLKYCKEYYLNHKKKMLKDQKEYYWKNKEKILPKVRAYEKKLNHNSPWIKVYRGIFQRCYNPNCASYKWYGAKGIRCEITSEELKTLWFRDNANSLIDPTVDRIDNKKHYEINNCRFIERAENTARANREKYGYV